MFDDFLKALREWLSWLIEAIGTLFYWVTDKIYAVIVGVWNLVVDSICSLVEIAFAAVNFNESMFSMAGHFAGLPTQVIYILNEIGMSTVLLMLSTALLIRLGLNLIPGALTRV